MYTERTGYTLAGWATSADTASADYTAGYTFEISGTTVLYAVWEANSYSIAFNSNGGSGGNTTYFVKHGEWLSSDQPDMAIYSEVITPKRMLTEQKYLIRI